MWLVGLMTVTTVIMMTHMTVNGQKDVELRIGETAYFSRSIFFSDSLFKDFHHCLCKGTNQCNVQYNEGGDCPDVCLAETVTRQAGIKTEDMFGNYYACTFEQGYSGIINCRKSANTVPSTDTTSRTTYRLKNSDCPSTCVGFIFTFSDEYIHFDSNKLHTDMCGPNCDCPSEETTSQTSSAETPSPSSLSSLSSLSSSTRASVVTVSTTKATTVQILSTTEHAEYNTTRGFTTNSGVHTSDPQSGSERTNDSPPIGIIVGAVVGVIVIIVIIIIIVVVLLRRKAEAKASGHAGQETSAMAANGIGVNGKTKDGKSHSYYKNEFSDASSELHASNDCVIKTNGYQNSLHQPNITKNSVTPRKDAPKPQFAIKDNDSDFGYSTAQLVVPEDNNKNMNGKKLRDDYDYVYAEDDVGVSDPNPQITKDKTSAVSPPKVRDDYVVVDKTRQNKTPSNMATSMGLTSDYDDIPEENYGYSHAVGDASAQGTSDAAVGNAHVTVPKSSLLGASNGNQDIGYESSRTSDGYTTVGNLNQPDPNNDDPNATSVYSRLHDPVRDLQNPYNVGPNTDDVYSKLHQEVRDIQNPYNVLPEPQVATDSDNALPDTVNSANDTKEQKPTKSLPYGKEDYAVVVKTKSTNKPAQSTFELGIDEN